MRNFIVIHALLFLIVAIFSVNSWPFLMLSVAQLVYIPLTLKLVRRENDWFSRSYAYFAFPAYAAIVLLQLTSTKWDGVFAAIYLVFTIIVAFYGLSRFLNRGFTNLEEFAIDMGLIYLAMGGGWYFAYIAGINTGFSPLLTWLTAIHFHYSAFLLPIFIGFIGRFQTSRLYRSVCVVLLAAPIVVAIGITFSRWIELVSVILYLFGLGGAIWIAWRLVFPNKLQKWLVRISFTALAVTITFSLLYVLGNGFGLTSVDIDFMLRFHGVLNCIVFALFGIIGWAVAVPQPRFRNPSFPVSQLHGLQDIEKIGWIGKHRGLSDDLRAYDFQQSTPSSTIIDFYENTIDYQLVATVNWHRWFKPFAFLYTFVSRRMQQINLPLSNEEIEMTGAIYTVQNGIDGRENVRAWVRKVGDDTTFTALYSQHETDERIYMSIALPLPFTTMTGILELNALGEDLQLTSRQPHHSISDAGIYLSIGRGRLFKLPLQEDFILQDMGDGHLKAEHKMWIFSLPFLTIHYSISRR